MYFHKQQCVARTMETNGITKNKTNQHKTELKNKGNTTKPA
jgi:hypothetical protein